MRRSTRYETSASGPAGRRTRAPRRRLVRASEDAATVQSRDRRCAHAIRGGVPRRRRRHAVRLTMSTSLRVFRRPARLRGRLASERAAPRCTVVRSVEARALKGAGAMRRPASPTNAGATRLRATSPCAARSRKPFRGRGESSETTTHSQSRRSSLTSTSGRGAPPPPHAGARASSADQHQPPAAVTRPPDSRAVSARSRLQHPDAARGEARTRRASCRTCAIAARASAASASETCSGLAARALSTMCRRTVSSRSAQARAVRAGN